MGAGMEVEAVRGPEAPATSDRREPPATFGAELRPTLALATPIVLAELGWMAMSVVDLIMVGRLGAEAIGAAGIGNVVFFTVTVLGIGILAGLDTFVSQAFGAGRVGECHRWLVQGLYLALGCAPLLMALIFGTVPWLGRWGIDPAVVARAGPYLGVQALSLPMLLVYFALRRYLQAMNLVRVAMATLLIANVLNLVGNWALIHGRLGLPALGLTGSAWATLISRTAMALILGGYAIWHSARHGTGLGQTPRAPDCSELRRLIGLGLPAAGQALLEVGVFGAAAVLAGRLGAIPLAAHEVVLHATCVSFMVPMGLSAAGSVRVGQAIGRGDRPGAARAGWSALVISTGFMTVSALLFLLLPQQILGTFTNDRAVLAAGLPLLWAAALFQIFDGIQVTAIGCLRGQGDTHSPMYVGMAAYWLFGLPLGAVLAFRSGWGVFGIWVGLTTGLIAAGLILLALWARAADRLRHGPAV